MGLVHNVKNITGGYTYSQRLVRNVTANNDSAPDEQEMHEIANLSFEPRELSLIMSTIKERLGDRKGNLHHIGKALTLIHYLAKHGSESVLTWCQQHQGLIDAINSEAGTNGITEDVARQARELALLLNDKHRLYAERKGTAIDPKTLNTKGKAYERATSRSGASGSGPTWWNSSGATFLV